MEYVQRLYVAFMSAWTLAVRTLLLLAMPRIEEHISLAFQLILDLYEPPGANMPELFEPPSLTESSIEEWKRFAQDLVLAHVLYEVSAQLGNWYFANTNVRTAMIHAIAYAWFVLLVAWMPIITFEMQ